MKILKEMLYLILSATCYVFFFMCDYCSVYELCVCCEHMSFVHKSLLKQSFWCEWDSLTKQSGSSWGEHVIGWVSRRGDKCQHHCRDESLTGVKYNAAFSKIEIVIIKFMAQ